MENEIIFNGMDIDDSFIVEQLFQEELINAEPKKNLNSCPNKKEEKDENELSNSYNENDYELTT